MEGVRDNPARLKGTGRGRLGMLYVLRGAAAAAAAFLLGFLAFCSLITDEPGEIGRADGIVALTGGEARIPEAVKLLARGNGRRLLISGVNPTTTRAELVSLMPDTRRLFNCCIDMDKVARDTIGNANETRTWMDKRRFRSLIVVTSTYHMPRSLAELRRALPDVELIPYPVKPKSVDVRAWWASTSTLQLLVSEYVKFMPAVARCVFSQTAHGRGAFNGTRRCLSPSAA